MPLNIRKIYTTSFSETVPNVNTMMYIFNNQISKNLSLMRQGYRNLYVIGMNIKQCILSEGQFSNACQNYNISPLTQKSQSQEFILQECMHTEKQHVIICNFVFVKNQRITHCPLKEDWLQKLWSVHTMGCYAVFKKNENVLSVQKDLYVILSIF